MIRIFRWLFRKKQPKKIKLGIALGSGGAKGFAELGALTAFYENGIEFDCVAGTSIGSIVGAFLANGYSPSQITELIKTIDIRDFTNFLMVKMDTIGIKNLIEKNLGVSNIEELKKPFGAVATEMESGEGRIFTSGNVADVLCASASYPPFFKPVVIEDKNYIDGAFYNSVPSDVVRSLGADYVVGIDLADHQPKTGFLNMLFPSYKGKVDKPWQKGYENSDVMLHPDLTGFSALSFKFGNQMFSMGYQEALKVIPKIKNDIELLKKKK